MMNLPAHLQVHMRSSGEWVAARAQSVKRAASLAQGHKGGWKRMTDRLQEKHRACIEQAAEGSSQGDGCSTPRCQHHQQDKALGLADADDDGAPFQLLSQTSSQETAPSGNHCQRSYCNACQQRRTCLMPTLPTTLPCCTLDRTACVRTQPSRR